MKEVVIIVKKILSTFLAVALILQTSAFASTNNYESDNYLIPAVEVEEVNGVRTAISSDDYTEYTVSVDRNTMSLSIVVKDLSTGTETSSTIYVNDIALMSQASVPSSVYTANQYAYEKTQSSTGMEWYLQRPKMKSEGTGAYYFKCWENNSNSAKLTAFESAVKNLSQKEADLAGAAGAEAAALFITGILGFFISGGITALAAPAVAALMAACDFAGPAITAGKAVTLQCTNCYEAIEAVYYATDNMHF